MGDSGLWGHVRREVTPMDASDCLRALSGGPVSVRLNIDVTTAIYMRVPRSSVIITTAGVCWICSWRCVRHHLTSAFDSADGTASQVTRVRVVDVKDYRVPALMKPREHSINYLVRVSNYPIAPPLLNPGFMHWYRNTKGVCQSEERVLIRLHGQFSAFHEPETLLISPGRCSRSA